MTEIAERTDFELIDALSRAVLNYAAALYKKGEIVWDDVKFENAWEDRSTAWADLEQRFEDLRALQGERDGGWQDIGTAPKTGEKIIVRLVNGEVFSATWHVYGGNPGWHVSTDIGFVGPRYWIPLPRPPHSKDSEG